MRRAVLAPLFALILFALPVATSAAPEPPSLFTTEQKAQQHCPSDTVVWLNLPSGIYHYKGQRYYANTKSGAFVCKKDADKAGDRATRNGQ